MKLRDRFLSWRKPLYSVPTLRGLVPLGITLYAGFVAFTRGSASHPLLVVLMSLITVMHLIESSSELRELELEPDPDATIFAGIPSKTRLFAKSGHLRAPLDLAVDYRSAGVQPFPEKRVVHFSPSGLFRYWRTFRFESMAFVLPAPIHHGVPLDTEESSVPQDPDELLPVRDPRLLPLRDQKIFLKTGKSVLRARAPGPARGGARIEWKTLERLSFPQRFEQLSFWIQNMEARPRLLEGGIEVSTPFFAPQILRSRPAWRRFKQAVARAAQDEPSAPGRNAR